MENWDSRYQSGQFTQAGPNRLLVELVAGMKPGKALDLACGAGRNAVFLAAEGWQVTAVDSSETGIAIARSMADERSLNIDFCVGDLETSEFEINEGTYNLICDFYYLQRDLFEAMKRGVKPGGFVVSAIHLFDESKPESKFKLMPGELRAFFGGFEILHYRESPPTDIDRGGDSRPTAEIVAQRKN